jgi:hypothetical protein
MRLLLLVIGAALAALAAAGCGGDREQASAPMDISTPLVASETPSVGPIVPPPLDPETELHPLVSGTETGQGIITSDTGEEMRVSTSRAGFLWRFESGERWQVTRSDGTVLMSGAVVGEALMYESVYGFVRLDDGRAVAYSYGIGPGWTVYPAEEVCSALGGVVEIPAAYVRDDVIEEEPLLESICGGVGKPPNRDDPCHDKMTGVIHGLAICLGELGIREGIQIVP